MMSSAKTKPRIIHRAVSGVVGIALVSSGLFVPIVVAHADPPAGTTYDLDKEIKSAPELKGVFDKKIDTSGVKASTESAVAPTDSVESSDAGMLAQNDSYLINDLDTEQTLSSPPISITESNTVTTAATQGLTLGFEQEIKAKAEFLGTGAESRTMFSASFNASWTQSKASTTSKTYTLPQQPVRVPAHTKVRVESWLQKVKIKGVLKPVTKLEGAVDLEKSCGGKVSVPIGELMGMLRDNGNTLHPAAMTTDGPIARFTGEIPFSGEVGTALHVRFYDDSKAPKSTTPSSSSESKGSGPDVGLPAEVASPGLPGDEVNPSSTAGGTDKDKPSVYLNSLVDRAQCPGGQNSPVDERKSSDGGWQKGEFQISGKKVDDMLPYAISISTLKYFWGAEWSNDDRAKKVHVKVKLIGDNGVNLSQTLRTETSQGTLTPSLYGVFGRLAPGKYWLSATVTVEGGYWGSTITSSQMGVDVTI